MDAPVELGEGVLERLHRVVELGAVDVVGRRPAQRRVNGVDLVVQHAGVGQLAEGAADLAQQRPDGAGKRSCSSRKRTTAAPSIGRRTARRYICRPDNERSTPIHSRSSYVPDPSPDPSRTPAARTPSTRVVMSARSNARPSRHIVYASSWLIVVARMPSMRRLSLTTWRMKRSRARRSAPRSDSTLTYMVEVVDGLPALDRDRLSRRPQVLPSRGHAAHDAAGIELIGQQVLDDDPLRDVAAEAFVVLGVAADDGDQRLPVRLGPPGQVGDGLGVGAHHPGGVLGTLEVARRPVDVVGNPRQQHGGINSFR